jgi:hypothetical protein
VIEAFVRRLNRALDLLLWGVDDFGDGFEVKAVGGRVRRQVGALAQDDILHDGAFFPDIDDVGTDAGEGVAKKDLVGRNDLGEGVGPDAAEFEGAAGGFVGEVQGADAAANALAVRAFEIEDVIDVKAVAEDGLDGAAAGDGAFGERFDEILTGDPLVVFVAVVQAILQEGKAVGIQARCHRRSPA